MSTYIERMFDEESELREKVNALRNFIKTNDIFNSLARDEQMRMIKQLSGMEIYLSALSERLMVLNCDI